MGWTQPVFNGFIVSQRWQSRHRRELREGPSVKVTRIGLDIAKQIFELHGVDRRGHVVVRKTLRRERVLEYFSQLPACEVALEACGGAHYWHRDASKITAYSRSHLRNLDPAGHHKRQTLRRC